MMRMARWRRRGALSIVLLVLALSVAPGAAAGTKPYRLTGNVRMATLEAFSTRATARLATPAQTPVDLASADYFILRADPTTGTFGFTLEASAGVPVAAVLIGEDAAAAEQLLAVGEPTADGMAWAESQFDVAQASAVAQEPKETGGRQVSGGVSALAAWQYTHGFFSTFWTDPLGITVNSVIDEAKWWYTGVNVDTLTGNDLRSWASWNGWWEVSHSIGAYYNANRTVGTIWTNDNFRTSSWFPFPTCGTTNSYYQANNAYGFANGNIGGGVNTWSTGGCAFLLSYTAFASPGTWS